MFQTFQKQDVLVLFPVFGCAITTDDWLYAGFGVLQTQEAGQDDVNTPNDRRLFLRPKVLHFRFNAVHGNAMCHRQRVNVRCIIANRSQTTMLVVDDAVFLSA
jgi:hypothetical protein